LSAAAVSVIAVASVEVARAIQSPRGWIFSASNRIIKADKPAARLR